MLSELSLKRLKDLTEKMAISGDEVEVRRYLEESYKTYGGELIADNLGSIALVKKSKHPNAKTVLLLGHMDEVGFVVKSINDKGNLSLASIGGWWSQTLLGQRVVVKAKDGQKYKGTIGSIPPHLLTEADRAKPMEIKNMLVDIGCTSKDDVLALGINTGSAVILDGSFEVLNEKRLLAKAFDNRYGCAMGLEALEAFKNVDLDVNLVVGASVQEEVGLRGAQTLSYTVKPDVAIIFDCSPANDASGDNEAFGQLGKGPLVRFIDANYLPNRGFLDLYVDTMEKHKLPYQYYQSLGGTDAGAVHKQFSGIPTLTMCICARNIHTNSSIIDQDDYQNAQIAMVKVIEQLNEKTIDQIVKANR